MTRTWVCLASILAVLLPIELAQAETARQVLVLYENNRLLPANVEADRGLNRVIAGFGSPVEVGAEFLDYPRFGGEENITLIRRRCWWRAAMARSISS
jgi:hypothetical protein